MGLPFEVPGSATTPVLGPVNGRGHDPGRDLGMVKLQPSTKRLRMLALGVLADSCRPVEVVGIQKHSIAGQHPHLSREELSLLHRYLRLRQL